MNKSTSIRALIGKKHSTLAEYSVGDDKVTVKETKLHRWFEYGDDSIQSIMHKQQPEQVLSPIAQTFLLFILMNDDYTNSCIKKEPSPNSINVLNLGLGGASIERALANNTSINITSLEASQIIVDIAKQYFLLPDQSDVICNSAEDYIAATTDTFNVILSDIFISSNNPSFLFTHNCYQHFKRISKANSVVIINSNISDGKQLLDVLLIIKHYFAYIALIEFDAYANLFIVCSDIPIPSKEKLGNNLDKLNKSSYLAALQSTELINTIENMRYIPHNNGDNTE